MAFPSWNYLLMMPFFNKPNRRLLGYLKLKLFNALQVTANQSPVSGILN